MNQIRGVAPGELATVWPAAALHLAAALARSGENYTLGDVRELIERADAMLWIVLGKNGIDGALVIYVSPRRHALTVWLMGGERFAEWVDNAQAALVRYARDAGLARVDAYMRPGLARKLRVNGWRADQVLASLEVDDDGQGTGTERHSDGHQQGRTSAVA
jgi:hypothetical protein